MSSIVVCLNLIIFYNYGRLNGQTILDSNKQQQKLNWPQHILAQLLLYFIIFVTMETIFCFNKEINKNMFRSLKISNCVESHFRLSFNLFCVCVGVGEKMERSHQGQSVSISDFKISSSDGLKFAKKLIKQQSYFLEQHVIRTHRCTDVFKFFWGPGYLGLWENLGDRLFLCYTFIVFV